MSFDRLGLSPELLRVVAREGYTTPTPVQDQAIPLVLAGRDVMAGAQTGTGKTAAFVLPMLQRLHAARPDGPRRIRALILAPTRELALQVEASVRTYGAERPIKSVAIYGGVGFDPQVRALRAGPEIVVATPGRLLDHVGQRTIDLSAVEILVLDEADRMLDMGFIRDIRKVLALLPAQPPEPALLRDVLERDPGARLRAPARPGVGPGRRAERTVRARRAARHPCRPRAEARTAQPPRQDRRHLPGIGLHPHEARRQPPRQAARAGRHPDDRDPRQQEPAAARAGTGRLQGQSLRDPRRHRGRGARARHRRPAARRQLRAADGPRGLRPPNWADRPRRGRRRGRLAGLHRRGAHAPRHRTRARPVDPVRGHPRLRARSADPPRADPPWRARWRSPGRRAARPSPAAPESCAAAPEPARAAVRRSSSAGSCRPSDAGSCGAAGPEPRTSPERRSRTPSGRSPVPTGPVAWSAAAPRGSPGAGSAARPRPAASTRRRAPRRPEPRRPDRTAG